MSRGEDVEFGVRAPARGAWTLLGLACVAVAFAAADTYVVVLALPDMTAAVGVSAHELQRAAPIISGFLLGYVAMLPLIGRIADLRGRVPVLVMSLVVFAAGSLMTALSYDLTSMVAGRFLQGVGGGGLVPATLALVADLYPVSRRSVPLGVVSAVQEIGSVLGPLFGALVLAVADWRAIFAINLAVAVVLALAIGGLVRRTDPGADRPRRRPHDLLGMLLLALAVGTAVLVFAPPAALQRHLAWGELYVPLAGSGRWLTPLGLLALAAGAAWVVRCCTAARPMADLRGWLRCLLDADLLGSLLLAVALGGVILAFATVDPKVQAVSDHGAWYLGGSALATAALAWHLRRSTAALIPRGALSRVPAWGALVVSFFVGAALIAALIDIPIFARTTVYPDSQLMAALVLVRFLVALPVGAVAGGYLARRWPAGAVTCLGMGLAAVSFVMMSRWGLASLEHPSANVPLMLGGLGFGLALAPVNAALFAATDRTVHGLAAALVVVARMVGMLVGISVLTVWGLRRFYAVQETLPPVVAVCDGASRCAEFTLLIREASLVPETAVFLGAAGCAAVAALLALVLFRHAPTR